MTSKGATRTGSIEHTLLLPIAVVLANAILGLIVLPAGIGFDDANITLNYAQNIASGHGYVYYPGGERVEGSTSPLWTMVNVLAVLLPGQAEIWLTVVSFGIALASVLVSVIAARELFAAASLPVGRAGPIVCAIFLILPFYFGWYIWSLMDIGLWGLTVATGFWSSVALTTKRSGRYMPAAFLVSVVLLPLVRPEGIVAAVGLSVLFGIFSRAHRNFAALAALCGILTFAVLTVIRWAYFGELVPNTYYAKVSTDRITQLSNGLRYVLNFFASPINFALVAAALAAPFVIRGNGRRVPGDVQIAWRIALLLALAGMAVYAALGGDHFGSFRFLLFLFPIAIPFAALTTAALLPPALLSWRTASRKLRLAALCCLLVIWSVFAVNRGNYDFEFEIAEEGREIGRILNDFPGQPEIAVVAAGGVSVTYEGVIRDLMGLNWVEMARAGRDEAAEFKNHGGFDRAVFFDALPEIVTPRIKECDQRSLESEFFVNMVLKGLYADPEFQSLYQFECWRGVRYYRRRDVPEPQGATRD